METLDYLSKINYAKIRESINDPEKLEQVMREELDKALFEAISWDLDRILFIEANQE